MLNKLSFPLQQLVCLIQTSPCNTEKAKQKSVKTQFCVVDLYPWSVFKRAVADDLLLSVLKDPSEIWSVAFVNASLTAAIFS